MTLQILSIRLLKCKVSELPSFFEHPASNIDFGKPQPYLLSHCLAYIVEVTLCLIIVVVRRVCQ